MDPELDRLSVNTIRFLAAEAVQAANSGHPGLPMGAAPAAYALWSRCMSFNPDNPAWPGRDRFVLSAGHGSALLYSLLHLFGFGLTVGDLRQFRQLGSRTPGHPEYGHTAGVEVTTGPLGQGIANAVGMAWAEKYMAATFNRPGHEIVDNYTFALCGDGCMMEGVSSEAASLAGTLGLGRLILLYDSNNITIEGGTDIAFRENVPDRFRAYGWDVSRVDDGNDPEAITKAIEAAKAVRDRPSLIEIKTVIGFGAPNKQGTAAAHGAPLGKDELRLAKENLGWPYAEEFFVPDEVREHFNEIRKKLALKEADWNAKLAGYKEAYPEDYEKWVSWHEPDYAKLLGADDFWEWDGDLATRISSEKVLNKACKLVPNLIGGAADLSPSTNTVMAGRGDFGPENPAGANLHFGVREHAMTAIANGMCLYGGLRPYAAGFFVFSDYMKPALRLSAMMGLPAIYVMTHDSIGVGEDGPTHEPVEQLAMLRSTPGFTVARPCDTRETAAAWYLALTRTHGPTAIVLSRQVLPALPGTGKAALRGGYVLKDFGKEDWTHVILIASGSEVGLIWKAAEALEARGIAARVVSMPSWEVFDEQDAEYKESVLPKAVRARVAVEAASGFGWERFAGLDGEIICMEGFGASGPAGKLFEKFGFTVENVVEKATKAASRR
ncbi:MAG: transketolase [Firmicutes bacterium]|nr:transketolase [Bacillota bacterium]